MELHFSKKKKKFAIEWQQRLADFHKVTRQSEDTLAQNSSNRAVDKAPWPQFSTLIQYSLMIKAQVVIRQENFL